MPVKYKIKSNGKTMSGPMFARYKPSKFSMDKDLNLRRLNPFKTDINIVRHNFKNQSQQTDPRKHFSGETYTTTSNMMNQSLREKNT
jgi:hypothetical protein